MTVEKLDKDILNVLLLDCRLSYRQIAKRVGVSVATVMHHIKRLEKEKIIKCYAARVDYDLLGYEFPVIIDIMVARGREVDIARKIVKDPCVYAVYDMTGDVDIQVIARFKNRSSMNTYVKKLQSLENVERTNTRIILNTLKLSPTEIF